MKKKRRRRWEPINFEHLFPACECVCVTHIHFHFDHQQYVVVKYTSRMRKSDLNGIANDDDNDDTP